MLEVVYFDDVMMYSFDKVTASHSHQYLHNFDSSCFYSNLLFCSYVVENLYMLSNNKDLTVVDCYVNLNTMKYKV